MTTETLTIETSAAHDGHADPTELQIFGFWLYVLSDLVLFATLFATYAVLGRNYAGGPTPKEMFDLPYVFGETVLLLFSSATCGLAILAVQAHRKDRVWIWLAITFVLGLAFVGMELREFSQLILEGHRPERSAFLSSFFTLVGTHGAHVTAGLIWIMAMIMQVFTKGLTPAVQSRLLRFSLFWHFLDIVWVGVFTVVYLMGVM
ncbi:MAG: cytochrome o ubiquinol oxidase subunit III [Desulfobacteraceae bacterium]|nr:cytochrome o ubiquinol oxidase subunit III [Desulfobacteraceae bacterium]